MKLTSLNMVDLSVVVLHFNRWDLTRDCLASIDAQEIPCTYEKVLVDNGSDIQLLLSQLPVGWRLVSYQANRGHIVGQNRCFESAQGEWVLFVANDVRLFPECLKELWEKREEISVPQLFTQTRHLDNKGLIWYWPGYGYPNGENGIQHFSSEGRISAMTGSCYLMPKWIWNEVGGFDERLMTSHEDIDFCLTARRMGHTIDGYGKAKAIHLGNATLRHQPSHNRAAFHRDRVYIVRKHYKGIDRFIRLCTIYLLDNIVSFWKR